MTTDNDRAQAHIENTARQIATDEAVLGMTPTNDKVDQSGADERAKFEAWYAEKHQGDAGIFTRFDFGNMEYRCAYIQQSWMAWSARAALQEAIADVIQKFAPQQAVAASSEPYATFQDRVQPWMMECFGAEISADRIERNHRFFEEATELVQANGMTRSEAHQLVDYTFGRPVGELHQEVGGVMVTLAALCLASNSNMHIAGEAELARIWTKVEKIRTKQAAKPKHSPLPESTNQPVQDKSKK